MASNPFRPTFGVTPPLLVGRDAEIRLFADALEGGPGAPGRAMLFTGVRGSGKTVILNALEDVARTQGWLVISETARPGVAAEIRDTRLPELLHKFAPGVMEKRVTGLTASMPGIVGAGVDREVIDRHPIVPSLRSRLEALTDALADGQTGVVLSIDELHTGAMADLKEITQVIQHMFREERDVAFIGAGLPSAIQDLLDEPGMTFLRRAEHRSMSSVSESDVAKALRMPIRNAGRKLSAEALSIAVAGTRRYPFLIQLVGHQIWDADRDAPIITKAHAVTGVANAVSRIGRLVHEPALNPLSAVDRAFLQAMSIDDGPSRMADVAARMGVDANYASQYRRRLIAAEIIAAPVHGRVDFAIPYLREYLRHQSTA